MRLIRGSGGERMRPDMSIQMSNVNAGRTARVRCPAVRRGLQWVGVTVRRGWLVALAISMLVAVAPPVSGQVLESVVEYPPVPPEKLADVILVLKPHADYPLHVLTPTEEVLSRSV